ncbi:MAG: hypothetical protein MUC79_10430 [Thiobacillaceae bacterium]|jgi:hypothetical protein|nr:hypothetical protein [Thiobacillaceae bacterium]
MLALRLLIIVLGAVIVFALLGYSLSRDPRWLRVAGYAVKAGLASAVLLVLLMLLARFLV